MEVPNPKKGNSRTKNKRLKKRTLHYRVPEGRKGSYSRVAVSVPLGRDGACSIRRGENSRAPYVRRIHLDNGRMGLNSYLEGDSFTLELFCSQNKVYVQNKRCPTLVPALL
ncbi:hypothetical protein CDAR_70801 [Caerostris darwini]|uniref:Uncharacterized protein n=1 Tax=Caerostris darwini TaxID=1538125 RepID=A0AAV4WF99_9ARAC|nr:hypothetical protein CDAR_70801 [Caerostris darwini]